MDIRKLILDVAKKDIGQKEIKGNQGFFDQMFEKEMEAVGFIKGHAWCSYYAERVWSIAYGNCDSTYVLELKELFSANAIRTYNRLVANGYKANEIPEPGDLVVWQYYKNGNPKKSGEWFLGHIGIVSEVTDNGFKSIEGNTNSEGGREGIEVAEKSRKFTWNTNNGLRLVGFIKPKIV